MKPNAMELPVTITVLKTDYNQEFVDLYWRDRLGDGKPMPPCPKLKEGQIFHTTLFAGMPEGFCEWAWGDIFKSLLLICGQAENAAPGSGQIFDKVVCCSDGWRPVIFHIEAFPANQ